jgi:hypothetical protein
VITPPVLLAFPHERSLLRPTLPACPVQKCRRQSVELGTYTGRATGIVFHARWTGLPGARQMMQTITTIGRCLCAMVA